MVKRRFLLFAALAAVIAAQAPAPAPDIFGYIRETWHTLTRSDRDLAKAAVDPKFSPGPEGKWAVYIPATGSVQTIEAGLRRDMKPTDFDQITLLTLPPDISQLKQQGLLYLPRPYVVPGGRFNEMYGWDSYFIQVGLLRDGEINLARDMADNFAFEVANYGKVLNANRTYYLTRSQPPFLSEMILNIFAKTHDRAWLQKAAPALDSYHKFWLSGGHMTETGLSRYYDAGEGPAAEVLSAEKNAAGQTHYDLVREYLKTHDVPDYDVSLYYDKNTDSLTPLFYKADRSMRESGFDPSNRFGAFNLDIVHYDAVCLNSLLYVMELQTAQIHDTLGLPGSADLREQARIRAERMNREMWSQEDGLYFDYNFLTKKVRRYPFLTTFFPLWAGIASKEQAAAVRGNLKVFERDGGLVTSTYASGNQWDAPFGWAPLEMIAVDGLRRYGYNDDANRIAVKFLKLVRQQFLQKGYIVEKYDVEHPGSDVSKRIHFGYSTNEAGFGWTNAAFTHLYDELPPELQKQVTTP